MSHFTNRIIDVRSVCLLMRPEVDACIPTASVGAGDVTGVFIVCGTSRCAVFLGNTGLFAVHENSVTEANLPR